MENKNIADEIISESNDSTKTRYSVISIMALIFFVLYLYSMFLGKTSIFTLFKLEDQRNELKEEFNKLQNENEQLQKKYFELRQLTTDEDAL